MVILVQCLAKIVTVETKSYVLESKIKPQDQAKLALNNYTLSTNLSWGHLCSSSYLTKPLSPFY